MNDWFKRPGCGGFGDGLTQLDMHSGTVYCTPLRGEDTDETTYARLRTIGDDHCARIYSDAGPGTKAATKALNIPLELASLCGTM